MLFNRDLGGRREKPMCYLRAGESRWVEGAACAQVSKQNVLGFCSKSQKPSGVTKRSPGKDVKSER